MARENKNQMPGTPEPELLRAAEPVKLFDDYYFVGNRLVGFHILKTTAGLVIFDAMETEDADEEFLIPGLRKLGLEQERICMIFLTHGHFDHYMGAEHVRLRSGCEIALSKEDTAYILWSNENRAPGKPQLAPRVTRLLRDGDTLSFGSHEVSVISAPGHTPGCLNYSFEVHDGEETHRVMMMGGYGVFGPGVYPDGDYPYGVIHAVDQALQFAVSCVKTWEYCKEKNCDVYINPHPQLCELLEHAEENKHRRPGEPNAFVIGKEGVRRWIAERFEVCMDCAQQFTDIRREYTE